MRFPFAEVELSFRPAVQTRPVSFALMGEWPAHLAMPAAE